jgi:hypothetical protein
MFADGQTALKMWKKYFCRLLKVCGINDGRLTEIHAVQSLAPETFLNVTFFERMKTHNIWY